MREFALTYFAVLAFLAPVAVYCFILAAINRRSKPLIVSGAWDAVGLLVGGGGFFLVTLPMLVTEFYRRALEVPDGDHFFAPWLHSWILWLVYFLLLVSGSVLMILGRAHKTMIYNVDAPQFPKALEETLRRVGLASTLNRQRLTLTPMIPEPSMAGTAIVEKRPPPAPVAAPEGRCAELVIETFPALAHVTLHWANYAPDVRADVERDLERTLEFAAPLDNPAAGWFLSVSGLIFGALIMVVLTIAFLFVFSRR